MTGREVWNLIRPILAQYIDTDCRYLSAYVIAYEALKRLDEAGEQE